MTRAFCQEKHAQARSGRFVKFWPLRKACAFSFTNTHSSCFNRVYTKLLQKHTLSVRGEFVCCVYQLAAGAGENGAGGVYAI
jgi:hypothetical protein